MGLLAAVIPSSMMASIQESAFDLAYIDDTSQAEAEGLFADAGAPIAESDAFKAWGKSITEGFSDCLKADFAFDWSKSPEDCVDGLSPAFSLYNATNLDFWSNSAPLEVQEVGFLRVARDIQKIEQDSSYWDETGKARFRQFSIYTNSKKCDTTCEEFSPLNDVMFLNFWHGVFAMAGLVDGWTVAHAMAKSPPTGTSQPTLQAYLTATEAVPMDPSTTGLPVATKTFLHLYHFTLFLYTPDSPKLGDIDLNPGEYGSLHSYLLSEGKMFHEGYAGTYGVPKRVSPMLQKVTADGVLGWGEVPYYIDPISSAVFTFNFVAGAAKYQAAAGAVPSAFMEVQMSSAFYHEGLGYVTQHYETAAGPTYNHSCAWDPDCGAPCFPTETCTPLAAAGYDGGKIPGTYFGSPKGAPGFPAFDNFILTYYLVISMTNAGRIAVPAKYKGPAAEDDDAWAYEGLFAMTLFKASGWTRRLENCNYPDGSLTESGSKDSPGIDCNFVMDSSPLAPFFGLPLYWNPMLREAPPEGWDSAITNAEGGPNQVPIQVHVLRKTCEGNNFCTDALAASGSPAYRAVLQYGYEPNLGALVDVSFTGALGWKLTITGMFHPDLAGIKMFPFFWFWNSLHLPAAILMDLSKLQGVPAALNGFYIFLLGQCMISLIGGVACCFCGV
jgi:hypothetical protein